MNNDRIFLRLASCVAVGRIIDAAQIYHRVETTFLMVAKQRAGCQPINRCDFNRHLVKRGNDGSCFFAQRFCDDVFQHNDSGPRNRIGTLDLVLQLQNAVDQRLGRGRTAGHIDIDRNDAVTAAHDRVAVVVVATPIGAGTHRNHPARFGHLVVHLAQGRRHFVAQRAGHNHHVRLPWARAKHDTEAIQVVARSTRVHHLHGAACQADKKLKWKF